RRPGRRRFVAAGSRTALPDAVGGHAADPAPRSGTEDAAARSSRETGPYYPRRPRGARPRATDAAHRGRSQGERREGRRAKWSLPRRIVVYARATESRRVDPAANESLPSASTSAEHPSQATAHRAAAERRARRGTGVPLSRRYDPRRFGQQRFGRRAPRIGQGERTATSPTAQQQGERSRPRRPLGAQPVWLLYSRLNRGEAARARVAVRARRGDQQYRDAIVSRGERHRLRGYPVAIPCLASEAPAAGANHAVRHQH